MLQIDLRGYLVSLAFKTHYISKMKGITFNPTSSVLLVSLLRKSFLTVLKLFIVTVQSV